jgi:triphosphoribosyl-dephospho-CoA synthase
MSSPADIAATAQLACLLEVSAPKPGNVSPGRHFADLRYEDFLASAAAIGRPMAGAGNRGVGKTIRLGVEATARWVSTNSNLGIVLLLAPLARAAIVGSQKDLRPALADVLDATTVDDAGQVYAAIRQAAPGGLGEVQSQDVAQEPDVTLLEAMKLAADHDGIAREYATRFDVTFEIGVPALIRARGDGLDWNDAIVETFLKLLANGPDTHIARRSGMDLAEDVSKRARRVLTSGGVRSIDGREEIAAMDLELREDGNKANPGTTADLTAATIFVALLNDLTVDRSSSSSGSS